MLGGALLVVLGAIALGGATSGRVYGHTHFHSSEPAPHWHLHFGRRDHHPGSAAHSHVPTIIGAAFAISSLRALTMLAPFGTGVESASLGRVLGLVAIFAVGILMSMSLFGVAFARLMSTEAILRLGRGSAVLMAFASMALGGYWIFAAI